MPISALIVAGSAVAGRGEGTHAAVAVVAEALGTGVLPANDAAGAIELGARNEFATAERMREVALIPALDDALPVDNHLGRPGLQLARFFAAPARRTGLRAVVVGGARATIRCGCGCECGGGCGCGQGKLAGRPVVDLDVLVRPSATLLATRCRRRACGRAARGGRGRAGLGPTWARYQLTACKINWITTPINVYS